jgi:hypothetical protein
MIEFALRYAQSGFRVMPLNGKIPLLPHGAHEAGREPERIEAWWKRWPKANIGMTLDGLVVVDIDPRNGGSVESLPELPDTCYARTGGGGYHYLYRAQDGVRYPGHPATGVDVKTGPGAYIVVEPSIHESGERYGWLDESEPWTTKPAPAPQWLSKPASPPTPSQPGQIANGRRNETLTAMAGAMRRKGMSVGAIEAALRAENANCVPPLPEDEVARIAASVGRYAPELPKEAQLPLAVTAGAVEADLLRVYREGLGRGTKTGWPSLDALFSVAEGQLTTITGWPNSGKSQFTDALALNLAKQGWKIVFCSLENIPVFLHVEKLAKQLIGKPLREGPTERMTESEIASASRQLDRCFSFLLPAEEKTNPSLRDVLQAAEGEFRKRELWGRDKLAVVIDPWNELEHVRPQGLSLTEHVGESLSLLRQWARRNKLHVFVIGHPAKQARNRDTGKLPVASPDMISDSAHFWNKSDNCITVALTDEHRSDLVDIHIQKIRFSHIGARGVATLRFDKTTGRYHEPLAADRYRAASEGD